MLEKFCGFSNNASLHFKDNTKIAKYIDSYVDKIMDYNFISQVSNNNGDDQMTTMIRQILLQDEGIKGNFFGSKHFRPF